MSHEIDSLDEFLNHRTSDRGSKFLKGWKDDGSIVVFLHTAVKPIALWVHNVPKIFVKDEGDDSVRRIFGGEWNCHESESTLKAQHRRDREGNRTHPPKKCPLCILIETVRDMVDEGQLSFVQPIFKFEGDIAKETRVIHAGGVYNHFSKDDLTKEEKRIMANAGISASENWNENMYAKGKYAFFIVNANSVGDGVQLTTEAGSLGDAVKDVIADAMDSAEPTELGDPFKHPYAIKWKFDKAEKVFSKKYAAAKYDKAKVTDEILSLIRGDKPDTSQVLKPFDAGAMRTHLERACLVRDRLPWDHIFGKREAAEAAPEEEDASFEHGHNARPAARTPEVGTRPAAPPPPAPNDVEIECDHCPGIIKMSDAACRHCGHVYAPPSPPPEKPRPRKRSEVAGQ